MPFSRAGLTSREIFLRRLVETDRVLVLLARGVVVAALAGLIATGVYLKFHDPAWPFFSYPAVRSAHLLCGLVLLLRLVYRGGAALARLAARLNRARGVTELWAALRPPPAMGGLTGWLLGTLYWVALGVLILTGLDSFAAGRYGAPLLPESVGLPWSKVHGLSASYFVTFMMLRLFYRGRRYLRNMRPYLYSP